MRGAEELLEEGPLFLVRPRPGLPHAEALGRLVGFRHPELTFLVHHHPNRIKHAVLNKCPQRRTPALAADFTGRHPVGGKHQHLLSLAAHAHIEPALLVGGHARGVRQVLDHGLHGAGGGIDRQDVAAIADHIDQRVVHGPHEAGFIHVDELDDLAGLRVQDGEEVHLHRGHLGREGLLDEPAVGLGEVVRGELGGVGHERRAVEQTVQDAHHVITHVRRPVIRRTEGFVDADLRILVEPPSQALFMPVAELLADGLGEAVVFVDLLHQRFPVLHVGATEGGG